MSDLFANPLEEMIEFQDLKTDLQRGRGPLLVTGCLDSQKVHLLSELSDLTPWKLIVTYDDSRAREICEDYRCFDTDISLYPARDLLFYTSDIHGNLLTKQRIQVMRRVLESSGGVVVTTIDGLMEHLLPLAWMKERSLTIGAEDVVEVGKLTHALAEMGYTGNFDLSYQRALSLYRYFQINRHLDLKRQNCEVLVCGSGTEGALRAYPDNASNTKNQRFLIHILPKPGVIN